jgi:hypothetical protein
MCPKICFVLLFDRLRSSCKPADLHRELRNDVIKLDFRVGTCVVRRSSLTPVLAQETNGEALGDGNAVDVPASGPETSITADTDEILDESIRINSMSSAPRAQ